MLTIDLNNLRKIDKTHGLSATELTSFGKNLPTYLKQFYTRDQHFHEIIDDRSVVQEIEQYARETKGKFDHIVVLGIGGSALGTLCLQQAFRPLYVQNTTKPTWPKVHVVDNIDPDMIRDLEHILTLKRTLFLVISKSGGTPETLSAFMYFKKKLMNAALPVRKHMVAITDPGPRFLRDVCGQEGIRVFDHGPVGGRFAVLSSVGLLPAALSGINIRKLLAGAREMRELFVSTNPRNNLPFQLAAVQYLLERKGKCMHVLMPYSQHLTLFADWFRQLLAESIGKEKDRNGKMVHVGITPISALGATDQHSQSQLYTEGPNDKLIIFLQVNNFGKKVSIPMLYPKEKSLSYIKGVDFATLLNTEQRATADAYTKYQKPNITLAIDCVDEAALGQLFLLFEGATAFLGEMYHIDAFNQPGVELSKVLTRKYLS